MKKFLLFLSVVFIAQLSRAQVYTFKNPDLVPVKLERLSPALRDVPETPPTARELSGAFAEHDNPSLEHPMKIVNDNALPSGEDPALQKFYSNETRHAGTPIATASTISNWAGLSAAVSPSDNTLAVGPNHVFQMTNNNTSTYIRIWNKAGTVLVANKLVKSITNITDYGDPQVLYDQQADKYLFVVLYSKSQKKLVVGVSQTPDPTGSYYVYTFSTPNGFPDYPKIGVWGNSYFITTNSNTPTIYALNRTAMLAGQSMGTAQMFSLSKFPNIGFQSASPISQTGSVAPPAGSPASVIRVADDAWSNTLGPDHLELFNLNINWTTPSLSTITGPINLNTIAYNSNLCGFGSGSCIPQPGTTTKLDPLSDIVMDKVQYRNLGAYESIVCSHICNADGNGRPGIRWYELRKVGNGSWSIYQQSTYAPDANGRFMSSITINSTGAIALGYNISSSSVYPGIRITGRDSCDAINTMTVAETIIKTGTAANSSIRYGDYNGIVTDPTDDSFWFTANYNTSSAWSTNVGHFNFTNCPAPVLQGEGTEARVSLDENNLSFKVIPNPANSEIRISYYAGSNQNTSVQIFDMTGKIVLQQNLSSLTGNNTSVLDVHAIESGCYFVKLSTATGIQTQRLVIQR